MSADLKPAWAALQAAADAWAGSRTKEAGQALSDAAVVYVEARQRSLRPAPSPNEPTLGFGRNKGKRPSEIGKADLEWYAKVLAENVENPEKARWREQNQALLDAVRAALGN